MTDEARIAELKAKLEGEIAELKEESKSLQAKINASEKVMGLFMTDQRAELSRVKDRLTECMVTRDACWPNPWFVLNTLEGFYAEVPLH